jgi:hypothetical protein
LDKKTKQNSAGRTILGNAIPSFHFENSSAIPEPMAALVSTLFYNIGSRKAGPDVGRHVR